MVGDPHLDAVSLGAARFGEVYDALKETVRYAADTGADGWVCLGDLFDPDSGPVVYRALDAIIYLASYLSDRGVPSLWIAGNHDVVEDGTGTTTLTPLRNIYSRPEFRCHVAEVPSVVRLKSGAPEIVALPYAATSHSYDPADFLRNRSGLDTKIVAGHLVVPGVSPGDEAMEYARGRDVFFPAEEAQGALAMVNGHHHRRQRSPQGVLIPGSLARLTFGEADHEPGFIVVEV